MQLNTGISQEERKALAGELSRLLADTYTLYLKTQNFHWNVKGPMFQTLHLLFEEQYNELALAIDAIAERIRALGEPAPGTFSAFARLSRVAETDGVPTATDMVRILVEGNETVIRGARALASPAESANDQATLDLATQRLQAHEKAAWMLRSHLAD